MQKDCRYGWLVVLGSFVICYLCDGIRNSYGLLFIEFLDEFGQSKSSTAWIGSLMFGLLNFFGPVTSLLVNRFGCRPVTVAGGVMCALGFAGSFFSSSPYHLYFSLGIPGGIGFSMLMIPFNVIITNYFEKKRSLAMGVAMCGSGMGSIVFGPLSKLLIDRYGWRGTVLIFGAMLLNCVPSGLVMRPFLTIGRSNIQEEQHLMLVETPQSAAAVSADYVQLESQSSRRELEDSAIASPVEYAEQANGILMSEKTAFDCKQCTSNDQPFNVNDNRPDASSNETLNTSKRSCLEEFQSYFNVALLKDYAFLLFLVSGFFEGLGYSVPFTFLPDMAGSLGQTRTQATLLLSVVGITSTISRVPIGFVADLRCVKRLYLLVTLLICFGVCILIMPFCETFAAMVVVCAGTGLFLGSYAVLIPLVLADLFGDSRISECKGFSCFIYGLAGLAGPPIAGAIFDGTDGYTMSFLVSGLEYILCGAILILILFVRK